MKYLHRLFAVASAAFFVASSAFAQSGTVTNHAYAIGKGTGVTGYTSLLCASGQFAIGQTAADPQCKTITGDVTFSALGVSTLGNIPTGTTAAGSILFSNIAAPGTPASGKISIWTDTTDKRLHDKNDAGTIGTTVVASTAGANQFAISVSAAGVLGYTQPSFANLTSSLACSQHPALTGDVTTSAGSCATTIAANAVTNAKMATMAANTIKANATGSIAVPTDVSIPALTQKVSPAASDKIMIADSAASDALKYATVSSIASAGSVSSIAGNTGAFTLGVGLTNSTNDIRLVFDPGSITNCTMAGTVSGNALTVALKTQAGATPSASSPCVIGFRNTTAATGDYTAVAVTAATTFATGTSGSTFGAANATPFRLWITAFNNAGTVVLGVSKQSTSTSVIALDESSFPTTGACSACTTANVAGTIYTTAGVSTLAFRILGYMDWSSGLTTAGTWASGPTKVQMMTPGIKKPGDLFSGSCASFAASSGSSTSSTTFVDTNTTLGITLTSAVNSVGYNASQETVSATSSAEALLTMARGGVAVGPQIVGAFGASGVGIASSSIIGSDFPGSVGPLTYTVRIKTPASSVSYNDSNGGSTICLAEIQN